MSSESSVPSSNQGRLHALDTLRFMAAAVVVFEHCPIAAHTSGSLPPVLLHTLDAYSAVAFFFVLSGFVLHLSLRRKAATLATVQGFLVKRVFRLYPLFYASLALGAIALVVPGLETNSVLASNEYTASVISRPDHGNAVQWLMQLVMIAPWTDNTFINPPMWTLAAEMRISLLFPLMSFVVRGRRISTAFLILVSSFAVCPLLAAKVIPTFGMIPLFFLGIVLAEYSNSLWLRGHWLSWLVGGWIVYVAAAWLGREVTGILGHFYIAGLGSAAVIVAILRSQALSNLLGHSRVAFLGECSYGIYILHFPLILSIAMLPIWATPLGITFFLVVFAAALGLSVVLFAIVERPMIEQGRRWERWIVARGLHDA